MTMHLTEIETLYHQFKQGLLTESEFTARKKSLIFGDAGKTSETGKISVGALLLRFWKKMFTWRGRDTRSEFWVPIGLAWAICIGILVLGEISDSEIVVPFFVLILIANLFGTVAGLVRRMHDVGKSAWFALMPVWGTALTIGFIIFLDEATRIRGSKLDLLFLLGTAISCLLPLIFASFPDTKGPNRYGDPR